MEKSACAFFMCVPPCFFLLLFLAALLHVFTNNIFYPANRQSTAGLYYLCIAIIVFHWFLMQFFFREWQYLSFSVSLCQRYSLCDAISYFTWMRCACECCFWWWWWWRWPKVAQNRNLCTANCTSHRKPNQTKPNRFIGGMNWKCIHCMWAEWLISNIHLNLLCCGPDSFFLALFGSLACNRFDYPPLHWPFDEYEMSFKVWLVPIFVIDAIFVGYFTHFASPKIASKKSVSIKLKFFTSIRARFFGHPI